MLRSPFDTDKTTWSILTAVALLGVAVWLYLPDILGSGPQGLHFIRQTDSLAFLMNYGQPSWNPLKPSVFDLRYAPQNGQAAAEFPLIYYLLALLHGGLELPYTSLRTVNLIIVLVGHFMLSRLAARWLGLPYIGFFFSLWMFSSSVVLYYAANYLPDAAAYGTILIGLCLILEGIEQEDRKSERMGAWILVLAGLMKTPAALYLLAYGCLVLFDGGRRKNERLRPVLIGALLIAAWNLYAIRYNAAHGTHYFMTWAEPIWAMSAAEVAETWGYIREYWWTKYLHPTTWHIVTALALTTLLAWRRIPGTMRQLLPWLLAGTTAFVLLFFRKFTDHDYYFLTVAPFLTLVALSGLRGLLAMWRWVYVPHLLATLLVIFSIMGMNLGHLNLERRYAGTADPLTVARCLDGSIQEAMEEWNVPASARFIVLGDPTPNGSLLFLERKGWTYDAAERIPPLDSLVQAGADHLVTIGRMDPPAQGFQLLKETRDWALFRVND